MMDDLQNSNPTCLSMRSQFDAWRNARSATDSDSDLATAGLELTAHLSQCPSCKTWRGQIENVEALANRMHQFDVPEALTQNILSTIARERKHKNWQEHAFFLPFAMLAFALVLIALPLDSFDGLCSWLLGCVIMIGLSVIKQGAVNSRSVAFR